MTGRQVTRDRQRGGSDGGVDAGQVDPSRRPGHRQRREHWEAHGIPVRLDVIPGMGHSGSRGVPHVQRFFSEVLRG